MDLITFTNFKITLIIFFVILTIPIIKAIFGAPFVPTPRKTMQRMFKSANIKPDQIFYDLGCGDGRFIREAARSYQAKAIGIELNPLLFLYAKFRSRKQKNETIFYQNFYKTELKNADIVVCYLMPKTMKKIEAKFKRELKPGCKIISHGFRLKSWKPAQVIEPTPKEYGRIYVYLKK